MQSHLMCFADLALQNRCMYNVQRAFVRLQSDLDPLVKPVQNPLTSPNSQSAIPQQHKPTKRRLPGPDDMHATNRIVLHVLRKVWHHPFVCVQQGNQARTCCILADVCELVCMWCAHKYPGFQSCFHRCCMQSIQVAGPAKHLHDCVRLVCAECFSSQ